MILQAAPRLSGSSESFRIGYTASKKIGKAHVRNKAKRRLRAVVRDVFPSMALDNVDYVLISRFNTADCKFKDLKSDIKWALKKTNKMLLGEDASSQNTEQPNTPSC